jgi:hypothetical protein
VIQDLIELIRAEKQSDNTVADPSTEAFFASTLRYIEFQKQKGGSIVEKYEQIKTIWLFMSQNKSGHDWFFIFVENWVVFGTLANQNPAVSAASDLNVFIWAVICKSHGQWSIFHWQQFLG